jgi:hypothetical protein
MPVLGFRSARRDLWPGVACVVCLVVAVGCAPSAAGSGSGGSPERPALVALPRGTSASTGCGARDTIQACLESALRPPAPPSQAPAAAGSAAESGLRGTDPRGNEDEPDVWPGTEGVTSGTAPAVQEASGTPASATTPSPAGPSEGSVASALPHRDSIWARRSPEPPVGPCTTGLDFLAPDLIRINDPEIEDTRQRILSTDVCAAIEEGLAQGLTLQQMVDSMTAAIAEATPTMLAFEQMIHDIAESPMVALQQARDGTFCTTCHSMLSTAQKGWVLVGYLIISYEEFLRQLRSYL